MFPLVSYCRGLLEAFRGLLRASRPSWQASKRRMRAQAGMPKCVGTHGCLESSVRQVAAALRLSTDRQTRPHRHPVDHSSEPESVLAVEMWIHASLPPPFPKRPGLIPQKTPKCLWEPSAVGSPLGKGAGSP